MSNARFVAYYRVSTKRQGQSGLGMEAQRKAIADYLNGGRWSLVSEFTEVESGKNKNRAELSKALALCRRQNATLVIAKLDRLARNVAFIAALMDSGVEFLAVDNPHANKLTVHILAVMAEHERDLISARTKAALAAAKSRGVKLGAANPNRHGNANQILTRARAVIAERAKGHALNVSPIIEQIRRSGVKGLHKIAEALNARGIPTARGGQWHATTVRNIIQCSSS